MTEKPVPRDFDWVTARAKCSIHVVLKELHKGADLDVEKRNSYRRQGDPSTWRLGASDQKGFTVFREEESLPSRSSSVDFEVLENGIKVSDHTETKFVAELTLNNEGRCVFKVDGVEQEQWQVRRRALERLFFGPI